MINRFGALTQNHKTKAILTMTAVFLIAWITWELYPERRTLVEVDQIECAEFDSNVISDIKRLDNLYVAYRKLDGTLYGLHDHFVFVSDDEGKSFDRRGKLPNKPNAGFFQTAKKILARSKIVRTLRDSIHPENLVVLPSGTVLVFYDQIYRSVDDGRSFSTVFDFRSDQGRLPFGGNEGVAVTGNGDVFFGEYNSGSRPHPIRILKGTDDGTKWQVIHKFSSGEIFHVHSVQYDSYRNRVWILTGDRDAEIHLYWSDPDNWQLHELGGGTQDWRIVSLIIRENDLIWGSDNDRTGASIFRWDFTTEELEKLQDIGKVSYFSTLLASGAIAINTTYEPQSSFVVENSPPATTDIWTSTNGVDWSKTLAFRHRDEVDENGYRARASSAFPAGTAGNYLFAYQFSTECEEGNTLRLKLK